MVTGNVQTPICHDAANDGDGYIVLRFTVGQPTVFDCTGSSATYTVPANVTALDVYAAGATGGPRVNRDLYPDGGKGGEVSGIATVTQGQQLSVAVGCAGDDGTAAGFGVGAGGGPGNNGHGHAGRGGGATSLRNQPGTTVLAAGGGGGGAGGSSSFYDGGHGGYAGRAPEGGQRGSGRQPGQGGGGGAVGQSAAGGGGGEGVGSASLSGVGGGGGGGAGSGGTSGTNGGSGGGGGGGRSTTASLAHPACYDGTQPGNGILVVAPADADLALVGMPSDLTIYQGEIGLHGPLWVPPTATDGDDPPPTPVCDHAPTENLAVGDTLVTCTVSDDDDANSPVSASFTVHVLALDIDLRVVGLPPSNEPLLAFATDATGAFVSWNAVVTDGNDPNPPPLVCDHASGSKFPIGDTLVTCTVTDDDTTPDGNSPITASFTVRVFPPQPPTPTFTSPDHAGFVVGIPGTFTITTTNATTVGLSTPDAHNPATLPNGLVFDDNGDGTATISGTPSAGTAGVYQYDIAAFSPGLLNIPFQRFALVVGAGSSNPTAPAITSAATTTFTVVLALDDTPAPPIPSFTMISTGGPVPTLSLTGTLPDGVTFQSNSDGTGTLAGMPVLGTAGTYPLTVTATNTAGSTNQSFTLEIDEPTTPGTPTIGTATRGNHQATLMWTAPVDDGGNDIIGYVVTPYIGTTAQTPQPFNDTLTTHNITNLNNGQTYTFKVAATNLVGTGSESGASNAVTPATVPDAPTIGTATRG